MKRKIYFLLLFLFSFAIAKSQNRTISGKVTSDNGEALSGATVTLKGTNTVTTTNSSGDYCLSIPSSGKEILIFSYVGRGKEEVTVGSRTTINISLTATSSTLNDVVVIGYGTVKRRDLTGAVTSIKSDEIKEIPSQSPLDAIQGKVAGADITRSNGSSSSGINITIRGDRSIGAGNAPLFIVDGVQTGNIDDINPNTSNPWSF